MSDPESWKAMATGGVRLTRSAKEQRINLTTIPSRETGEGIWYLSNAVSNHPVVIGQWL